MHKFHASYLCTSTFSTAVFRVFPVVFSSFADSTKPAD
jgi:hypothetical protein